MCVFCVAISSFVSFPFRINNMTLSHLAAAVVGCLVVSANASMTGVCAFVRTAGDYTLVDLYATFTVSNNRLQNVILQRLSTSAAGGFVQGSSPGLKGWAPDSALTSTHDSLDSFVTIGESTYGDPSGQTYANVSVQSSSFPSGTWNGTPFGPSSNSISASYPGCSWFNDSINPSTPAVVLSGLGGRVNVAGAGTTGEYGTWFAHLVIAGTGPATIDIGQWNAYYQFWPFAGFYDYSSSTVDSSFTVPAPGAISAIALAVLGLGGRRRMSNRMD